MADRSSLRPASAKGQGGVPTLINGIYRGFVLDGSGPDDLGLFGPIGASLIGHGFVATFEMDISKGIPLFTATENYIHGGSLHGVDSPMLSATLEIDGKKVEVGTPDP